MCNFEVPDDNWRDAIGRLEGLLQSGYSLLAEEDAEAAWISLLDKDGQTVLICDSLVDMLFDHSFRELS